MGRGTPRPPFGRSLLLLTVVSDVGTLHPGLEVMPRTTRPDLKYVSGALNPCSVERKKMGKSNSSGSSRPRMTQITSSFNPFVLLPYSFSRSRYPVSTVKVLVSTRFDK